MCALVAGVFILQIIDNALNHLYRIQRIIPKTLKLRAAATKRLTQHEYDLLRRALESEEYTPELKILPRLKSRRLNARRALTKMQNLRSPGENANIADQIVRFRPTQRWSEARVQQLKTLVA